VLFLLFHVLANSRIRPLDLSIGIVSSYKLEWVYVAAADHKHIRATMEKCPHVELTVSIDSDPNTGIYPRPRCASRAALASITRALFESDGMISVGF
jgi:hypothetical protein